MRWIIAAIRLPPGIHPLVRGDCESRHGYGVEAKRQITSRAVIDMSKAKSSGWLSLRG